MQPRHRIDIAASDLAAAAAACIVPRPTAPLAAQIEREWAGEVAIVCLSVRSAFDLLLGALAYPAGDEIVVSAVTHPDMVRIIEAHGLVAIPVDVDLATLSPRVDLLDRALSARTRLVMVVHLFGGRCDLGAIVERLAGTGILLVEDCAQTLRGPHDVGDPRSDAALFSFGMIKTATALGGALVRVADPMLLGRMRALAAAWPTQGRATFARKVAAAAVLRLASSPSVFGALTLLLRALRLDIDTLIGGTARGFPADRARFFARIRQRPSAPLLVLLRRRLRRFDARRLERRAALGERLAEAVQAPLVHPGGGALHRTHWLFPVLTADPVSFIARLRASGFDATQRTTGIGAVRAPADRAELEPAEAHRLMRGVVFIPAYPELPEPAQERLAALLRQ